MVAQAGWCQIFGRLQHSNGSMPGLPGGSSFCDVQDLAAAFVAAATAGPGRGERYVVGGTNATSLEMQAIMAELVGVPAPSKPVRPPPELFSDSQSWINQASEISHLDLFSSRQERLPNDASRCETSRNVASI